MIIRKLRPNLVRVGHEVRVAVLDPHQGLGLGGHLQHGPEDVEAKGPHLLDEVDVLLEHLDTLVIQTGHLAAQESLPPGNSAANIKCCT